MTQTTEQELIERYNPDNSGKTTETIMWKEDDGQWVRYEDYAAQQAEISTLRAQLDKAREVKPLVWVENSHREYWYTASGMGVQYEVKEIVLGKWWLSIDGEMLTFPFDYAHNAKASAQSDYQRRYNAMSAQEGE